ncbi:oxidoreductase [Gonapodya prolifera JEL478]|uniref:Oxidoreductase n=1 Tax=Gonapodya prolifera (strain JEL478) TaxID=1344416 RepID=A0A139A9D8_GONPJ|nr:oxidoreductase [Gonapodya prolifera JEL478]|eukprot:KXS13432.1 oxidoreductase [Gonapodya prolifera JEL478]
MADILPLESLFGVKGKVAVVTGGGTGIGKMITAALARNGAKVYIASRKLQVLKQTADEINAMDATKSSGGKVIAIQADLRGRAQCDALAAQVVQSESKVHILVNNAGIAWGDKLADFNEESGWINTMKVNVVAYFYLTVAFLPLLSAASQATDPARVIQISSIASLNPSTAHDPVAAAGTGTYSYGVSKAAVNQLTKSMAFTLSGKGINVNALAPGRYLSRMTQISGLDPGLKKATKNEQPMGRIGDNNDMAGLALFLCSRAGAHITGSIIETAGGAHLFPQGAAPEGFVGVPKL